MAGSYRPGLISLLADEGLYRRVRSSWPNNETRRVPCLCGACLPSGAIIISAVILKKHTYLKVLHAHISLERHFSVCLAELDDREQRCRVNLKTWMVIREKERAHAWSNCRLASATNPSPSISRTLSIPRLLNQLQAKHSTTSAVQTGGSHLIKTPA